MLLQSDGFGSDSLRLIKQLQRDATRIQILLFSATFNERVRGFAQKVAGPDANQVAQPVFPALLKCLRFLGNTLYPGR